jgi:hypothetical protein
VDLSWGHVRIVRRDGAFLTCKDVKLYPGGSRPWDWNETGTRHDPGIQAADVEELLEAGADVVVLGRGVHERLGITEAARRRLAEAGAEVHVLATPVAAERYEELREAGRAVGALLHTTC